MEKNPQHLEEIILYIVNRSSLFDLVNDINILHLNIFHIKGYEYILWELKMKTFEERI